jgi:hypothetical protein
MADRKIDLKTVVLLEELAWRNEHGPYTATFPETEPKPIRLSTSAKILSEAFQIALQLSVWQQNMGSLITGVL